MDEYFTVNHFVRGSTHATQGRFRMATFRRWRVEGGTYFFTVVTYGRRRILTDERSRSFLREAFRSVRARYPFQVLAIVLLPDHLHTVWELPRGDSDYITRWRQIKSLFTRSYVQTMPAAASLRPSNSQRERQEHPIWQRRFFEHTCRNESDLKRCVDYTHFNPVKHGLVQQVCEWQWSSFHRYVELGEYDREWGGRVDGYGQSLKWAD